MPPKPFPYPLTIGTDILHLPRLHRLIIGNPHTKHPNYLLQRFVRRILTRPEIVRLERTFPKWKHFSNRHTEQDSLEENEHVISEKDKEGIVRWLGGRWAVKEAARKAVGAGRCGWKDVWVKVEEGGNVECVVRVRGKSLEPVDTGKGILDKDAPLNGGQRNEREKDLGTEPLARTGEGWNEEINWEDDEGRMARCSISHDGEYVTAVVLAIEERRDG